MRGGMDDSQEFWAGNLVPVCMWYSSGQRSKGVCHWHFGAGTLAEKCWTISGRWTMR